MRRTTSSAFVRKNLQIPERPTISGRSTAFRFAQRQAVDASWPATRWLPGRGVASSVAEFSDRKIMRMSISLNSIETR